MITIFITVLLSLVACVLYAVIGVIIHGLYERHCFIKHGLSLKERYTEMDPTSAEWDRAHDDHDFSYIMSALWPLAPLLYLIRMILRGIIKLYRFVAPPLRRVHVSTIYTGLESKGASSEDHKTGAYRS